MHLDQQDPPQSAGYWRTWYLLVIGWLALLIILFDLFTRFFS